MTNNQPISYTTEEIADLLKVSKLTVYDLIKKGDLSAYRVGRQMRIDEKDLEDYKERMKTGSSMTQAKTSVSEPAADEEPVISPAAPKVTKPLHSQASVPFIISGQDMSLDLLSNAIDKTGLGYRSLRSYTGSLNSLVAMYNGGADLVSMHLFDGDTETYNVPYVKRILVGHPMIVVNLLFRKAGFYVQKGNPARISNWTDLKRSDITIVNREKGSGIRVLVDEMLRKSGISRHEVNGYFAEESNHIAVASAVASGKATVGVGIEKASKIVPVDFIPVINEQYDIVMFKTEENKPLRDAVLSILRSPQFQEELNAMGGYDLSLTGTILYET